MVRVRTSSPADCVVLFGHPFLYLRQAAFGPWYKLGELQPFDDAPIFDAMVRELQE